MPTNTTSHTQPRRQTHLEFLFRAAERGLVERIVLEGSAQMADIAADTLRMVRRAMGIDRTLVRFRRKIQRAGR